VALCLLAIVVPSHIPLWGWIAIALSVLLILILPRKQIQRLLDWFGWPP
jgi:hypothetical protein